MDNKDLLAKLGRVALARENHDEKKAKLDAARAAFDAEHADLIEEVAAAANELATADIDLRIAAEQRFAETGEKKPLTGIEVKEFEKFETPDMVEARIFCDIHMPGLLTIDWKLYEAVFKAVGDKLKMPGKIEKTAKATVGRDLSAYKPGPAVTSATDCHFVTATVTVRE